MRTVYVFNMVTLDGFFEGPKKWEIDWHNVDDEFNEFAIDQLHKTDVIWFGRVTYEGMAGYWPTPRAMESDPVIAGKMNSIEKVVVSKTLNKADWSNTKLIRDHVEEEMTRMKQQPGKDIAIFGSGNLASTLEASGVIDEYRLVVNPVILGSGHPLFTEMKERRHVRLLRSKTFKSGNVLLAYAKNGKLNS